jgi:hypothetical protein
VLGVPTPTALLVGGLITGIVLAALSRLVNRFGARRRARRARRDLYDRVAQVAEELIVTPLEREIAAHAALVRALGGHSRRPARRGTVREPALVP